MDNFSQTKALKCSSKYCGFIYFVELRLKCFGVRKCVHLNSGDKDMTFHSFSLQIHSNVNLEYRALNNLESLWDVLNLHRSDVFAGKRNQDVNCFTVGRGSSHLPATAWRLYLENCVNKILVSV